MADFSTTDMYKHAVREMSLGNVPPKARSVVFRILQAMLESELDEFDAYRALKTAEGLYGFMPMTELTGEDVEWKEVTEEGVPFTHVNIRCPRIFKTEDGRYVDLMRFAWRAPTGELTFDERGAQYVDMPYWPRTDVIENE